jgi:hypothetical protein
LARLSQSKHRLSLLTGGARDLPMRQQTLRNAIAWSYDLLDVREQALFARLGVFAGGFTLDAVEAICGDRALAEEIDPAAPKTRALLSSKAELADHVLRINRCLNELTNWAMRSPAWQLAVAADEIAGLLESLASKSLVRQVEAGHTPRFTMLETIREFALERLAESNEEQPMRWRHAGYYAWLHGTTDSWVHPGGIATLEVEIDNLRTTLGWSIESGESLPGLLIGRDHTFWGDHANEGQRWLQLLLAQPHPDTHTAADAWYCASALALFNHNYADARTSIESCYRMYAALGDPEDEQIEKYFTLGIAALGEGDIPRAGALFEQLLDAARADLNRTETVAWAQYGLGCYHLMAGTASEAQRHLEACLAFFRAADTAGVIDSLKKLGFAAYAQDNLSRAVVHFRESIELARARHLRRSIAANLFGFASVALSQGALERSARLFGAAEALSEMTSGLDPDEQQVATRDSAVLREQLDLATLEQYWAEGRALDWEQAIEYALAEDG